MNWALNVYPLLRPGLSTLYDKMRGKTKPFQPIWVSVTLTQELLWFADKLTTLPGVHLMFSNAWTPSQADIVFYMDACLSGLAFWSPSSTRAFQSPVTDPSLGHIFFWEALAVVSALHWALTSLSPPPRRIAVYTDNSNSKRVHVSLLTTNDSLLSGRAAV